jgi:hypothetical protein
MQILKAVFNTTNNFFTLRVTSTGNFTVNWGDGTGNISYPSGTLISYNYTYSNVSAGTEITVDGITYRQALINISGTSITNIELNLKHTSTSANIGHESYILDLQLEIPSLTSFSLANAINSDRVQFHKVIESAYIGANTITTIPNSFFECRNLRRLVFTIPNNSISFASAFSGCYNLSDIRFIGDTTNPRITSLSATFQRCRSLMVTPWMNTANCTDFSSAFAGCGGLTEIPFYNTGSSTSFNQTFSGCTSLRGVPPLNLSSATTVTSMFITCTSLLSSPAFTVTSSCTNFSAMFRDCFNLKNVALFNTSGGTNFSSMFLGCYSLLTIPLFDTSAGTDLSLMFYGCSSLLDVPLLNTGLASNMSSMFSSCISLRAVPLFTTTRVTNMVSMFYSCVSLKTIPQFNTVLVTNMANMFFFCDSLVTIPLLNMSSTLNVSSMFGFCRSLKSLPALNLGAVSNSANMDSFSASCNSLSRIQVFGARFGNFTVSNSSLSTDALIELFTGLGTASGTQTISITGCPGATGLTAGNRAIATAKGWTITG